MISIGYLDFAKFVLFPVLVWMFENTNEKETLEKCIYYTCHLYDTHRYMKKYSNPYYDIDLPKVNIEL